MDKFYKNIIGYKFYKLGIRKNISGIKIINKSKVKIKFKKFDDNFEKSLIIPLVSKFSFRNINVRKFFKTENNIILNGCGPFKFYLLDDKKIKFIKNENFHLGAPKIENMYIYYGSKSRQLKMLKNEEVDFTVIDYDDVEKISDNYKIYDLPILKTSIIEIINNDIIKSFDKRRYLSSIIPRDRIVNEIFKGYANKIDQNYPKVICDKYNIKEYEKDENILPNVKGKFIIAYFDDVKLKIINILNEEFAVKGINFIAKKYKNIQEAKKEADFIILDLYHQIMGNSNNYIKNIASNYNDEYILKLMNEENNTKEEMLKISNWFRENKPIIPLISYRELQIINSKIENIKYDNRGILANIHKLIKN